MVQCSQHGEKPLNIIQGLVEHARVCVEEADRQPLEDKVKVVHSFFLQALEALASGEELKI